MEIVSIGWATELALLAARGSKVEQHRTHLVVRTPDRPDSRSENFVLLPRVPLDRDVDIALGRYVDAFGSDSALSLGIDAPDAVRGDVKALGAGLTVECDVVLVATEVEHPMLADVEVHVDESDPAEVRLEAWARGRMAGTAGLAVVGEWARLHPPRTSGVDRLAGIAQLLVHAAWAHAVRQEGLRGLVAVADEDHPAVPDYLGWGFVARERQVRVHR